MHRYIARRLLISIPVFLAITIIVFLLINLAPGDPVDAMVDPSQSLSREALDALRENLGLNKPLPVRYVIWLRELVQGNLGYSLQTWRPVSEMVWRAMGNTVLLTALSLLMALIIGVGLGIVSALRRYSWLDYGLTVLAFAAISIPHFFVGLLAIYIFAVKVHWFPAGGITTIGVAGRSFTDVLWHLTLPTLVLGFRNVAEYLRYTRSSMLEVLGMDYVNVARAKGLSEWLVMSRHAFRNALLPVLTLIGLRLPFLFSGSVIIEVVFSWPGMGLLAVESIGKRDYPTIMGVTLVMAVVVLVANLLTDISYAAADPRVHYE
jgi:peptide/nickel transport system permease protein